MQGIAYALKQPLGQDFVQFELAGRRETTLLIDTCHARHFAFGLQSQMLQDIAF